MTWHGICFKIPSYSPERICLLMFVCSCLPTHVHLLIRSLTNVVKNLILGGISQFNKHVLILNGHGSHVTLEVIKQVQTFGLHMITLHSHTSHGL